MRIIKTLHLEEYARRHPTTAASIQYWISVVKDADWQSTQDVADAFPKAKRLKNNRVRFEIAGGNHRLIAQFAFPWGAVYIKFIGTHAEYDAEDANTVSLY